MTILHLRSSEFFGGPERQIVGQCRAMPQHHFICASYVRRGTANAFLAECASRSIHTRALKQGHVLDMRPIGSLRTAVLTHDIDIVVSHDYKSNLLAAVALRKLRTAHVAHYRGRTMEDAKVRFYNAMDLWTLRSMDRVFVVCRAARDQLVHEGVDPSRLRIVANAFEWGDTQQPARPVPVINLDEPVQMIAAGRLSKEKGFDLLIAVAERLHRAGAHFHLRIFGSGPEEERIRKQILRANVESCVHLMGFTSDLAGRMRESHLLVVPSRSEGMPNVVLEAWAHGLAVVATPAGGVPEMIDHGVNGILSEDISVSSLHLALSEALREPHLLRDLALNGQSKLKSHFSFDEQARQLELHYRDVSLHRGRRGAYGKSE